MAKSEDIKNAFTINKQFISRHRESSTVQLDKRPMSRQLSFRFFRHKSVSFLLKLNRLHPGQPPNCKNLRRDISFPLRLMVTFSAVGEMAAEFFLVFRGFNELTHYNLSSISCIYCQMTPNFLLCSTTHTLHIVQ